MRRIFYILGCMAMAAPMAHAVTTSHLADDTAALSIFSESDVAWVAEGRIGNNAFNGDFELDLGQSTAAPNQTAQFSWPNGGSVLWSLSYNPILNAVDFIVGQTLLSYNPGAPFTDLFIRTRAVNDFTGINVDNLVLDGNPLLDSSEAYGSSGDGVDYLWISGSNLMDGFFLAGTTTMGWEVLPLHSRLAFQIKAVEMDQPIPEPATLGLVGLGLASIGAMSRRRKKA